MKISQFILVLGFGLLSLNSQAQDTHTEEAPVQEKRQQQVRHVRLSPSDQKVTRVNDLKTKLNLTEEQAISYDEINARYRADIQEARQTHSDDRDAMQQTAKTLRENHRQEILAILTPEQAEIYRTETTKRHSRRATRPQEQDRG